MEHSISSSNTGRDIDRHRTDLGHQAVRITCPVCHEQHEWHVGEAQLVKAD